MRQNIFTIAMLFACTGPLLSQETVRAGQSVSLGSGPVVIYDAVGNVTMRRGGNAVTVTATPRGPDGSQLQFATDRDEQGRARFRVVFPDVDRIADPEGARGGRRYDSGRTTLNLRRDGTFGGDNNEGSWRRRREEQIEIGGSSGFRGWADLEITVPAGAEVVVHLAVGHSNIEGVDGKVTIDTWNANAEARNIAGDWLFDTGSGDVTVTGARGTLRIDTGSGSGTVSGLQGELLDIDTGSGNVDATDVRVTRFRFDTGSGNVRARGVTAQRGVADTGSGDVEISYVGGTIEDLLIDTGSGSARLTLPPTADVRVTVDSGSGDITVDRAGGLFERRSDEGMVLRFGEGRGRIRIDTGSGDVVIR